MEVNIKPSLRTLRTIPLVVRVLAPCFLALFFSVVSSSFATTIYDGFGDQFVDRAVYAVAYFNGDLIVGGAFNWAGGQTGRYLSRWNGTQWMAMNMPGTIPNQLGVPYGVVYALAVYKNELYIGGQMRKVSGAPSDNIIRWDGTTYKSLNFGVNGPVYALLSSGNDLYVGGHFISAGSVPISHVARWDGASWNALGSGLNGDVYGLIEFGGELVACGNFNFGGTPTQVAAWNGTTWDALGQHFGVSDYVFNLAVFNGVLVAGGRFTLSGGSNLAWLDGNVWKPLGGGTNDEVDALAVTGGKLYVGGSSMGFDGIPTNHVGTWDGTAWSSLTSGLQGQVFDGPYCSELFVDGTNVVVGGGFELAGGLDAPNLAIWDGSNWSNLPSNYSKGLNGPAKAFLNSGGALIVGGSFTWAAGHHVNRIARWNGAWTAYGSGFDDGQVNALAEFNGAIVAGGTFTMSAGQAVNRIAMWNGTSWLPMGTGFPGNQVVALAVYNGQVVAGGTYTPSGGASTTRIVLWDGTIWQSMGGFSSRMSTLTIYNGELYAGGYFGLAKWNGSTWVGISFLGTVSSMAISNGELFVCGPQSLMRFNGTTWSAVNRPTVGPDYIADYFGLLVGSGGLSTSAADYGLIALVPGTNWYMLAKATGPNVPPDQVPVLGPMLDHDGNFAKGLFVGGDFVQMGGVPSRGIALLNPELKSTAVQEDHVHPRLQAFPNPFQRSLAIEFTLESRTQVEVTIYDIAGRRVATLLDQDLPAGTHEATWDARNAKGQRAPAGVYFVRVQQGEHADSRQIVLVD